MIITIFGATGMVGKQLVNYALAKGYTVKAFGRNVYSAGFTELQNLQLVQGAVFDDEQLYSAIKGSDAVLSALGGAFDGTDKSRSLGMKHIVSQMECAGVKRIVALGGLGTLDAPDEDEGLIMNSPSYPKEYLPVGREHYQAYEYLKNSSLDWTFVAAPDLVDAPFTGLYQTAANYPPAVNNNRINTGDLARFMVDELTKNEYVQFRVGISN